METFPLAHLTAHLHLSHSESKEATLKAFITVAAAALIAGCANAPTDTRGRLLTLADVGAPPASPMQVVREALRTHLKDPDSALVRMIGSPTAMVLQKVPMVTTGGAGWRICADVNAKNSYGGYTGYKRVFVLWSGGLVIDYLDDDFGEIACRGA